MSNQLNRRWINWQIESVCGACLRVYPRTRLTKTKEIKEKVYLALKKEYPFVFKQDLICDKCKQTAERTALLDAL